MPTKLISSLHQVNTCGASKPANTTLKILLDDK